MENKFIIRRGIWKTSGIEKVERLPRLATRREVPLAVRTLK
jgi:hypothetical protein